MRVQIVTAAVALALVQGPQAQQAANAQQQCQVVFDSIEITQAVQTYPSNTVPLISLRPTTARVYLHPEPSTCVIPNVEGELYYSMTGMPGRFIPQADNKSITVREYGIDSTSRQ